jgi:hypothetical protein
MINLLLATATIMIADPAASHFTHAACDNQAERATLLEIYKDESDENYKGKLSPLKAYLKDFWEMGEK